MPLVIHIVEQTYGLPKIDIFAAQFGEMLHRIGNRVAMFSQAFGLHPFVENSEGARGQAHLKNEGRGKKDEAQVRQFPKSPRRRAKTCRAHTIMLRFGTSPGPIGTRFSIPK